MKIKQPQQIKYPRFIQNKPRGIDKLDGRSQKRLAKAIASHFLQNDSLSKDFAMPRIIGIEGAWGSGKSNVVKILKEELTDKYYFYEYDAWGHQEDLQRRSILELLTSKLLADGFLSGDTLIRNKEGRDVPVNWEEKLKLLLARKTETKTEKYPLISPGMVAAFMVSVLTPIFTFIAYATKPIQTSLESTVLSIFIAALPAIVAIVVWIIAYLKDKKYGLSYLLAIYQDKIESAICYQTLSVDEPTVYEFKAWIQDISDFLEKDGQKKLVIIFDNMDRLPAEKVKRLWSLIHTFFADDGFDNVWAVIPFDEQHLGCAFGDESDEKTKQLTKYFINKTFPIVYRVAPPVITDYRSIINKFFTEAFGNTENAEIINRIFRTAKPNANVREIISFINEMVALKQEWGDSISLNNVAIFCLKKEQLLENPAKQILSGDYLEEIGIINNDMKTQQEIAALVYGVDVEHAKQIPLTKYIQRCIDKEKDYDINKYSDYEQFDTVLEEAVWNGNNINSLINSLHLLKKNNDRISLIWKNIAEIIITNQNSLKSFPVAYKKLLIHLDSNTQKHVITKLYESLYNFNETTIKNYIYTLIEIENFIITNNIQFSLKSIIKEKNVLPDIFINFIRTVNNIDIQFKNNDVKNVYKFCQITTDFNDLDNYLSDLLPYKFSHVDIIKFLKNDSNYTFFNLLERIKRTIMLNHVNTGNLGVIFNTYRLLAPSEERPLREQLDEDFLRNYEILFNPNVNLIESGYYDLIAMRLVHGLPFSLAKNSEIKHLAEIIEFYSDQGDLLIKSIDNSNLQLNQLLQYIVNNKIRGKLNVSEILPKFKNIKNKIKVTDKSFIEHLSNCSYNLNEFINKNNLEEVIPDASFYDLTSRVNNVLTAHINNTAILKLSEVDSNLLYKNRYDYEYYWLKSTKYLLSLINSIPENLNVFCNKLLIEIAYDSRILSSMPDFYLNMIKKIDTRTICSTIINIRDKFCIDKFIINPEKFLFFEHWFRLFGDLNCKSNDVCNKILKPVINNDECINIILENQSFYIDLIRKAGDHADDLKLKLLEVSKQSTNERLTDFVEELIQDSSYKHL